jgi:hypothetical protein
MYGRIEWLFIVKSIITAYTPTKFSITRDLIDVAITGAMGGSEHGIIQPPHNRSVAGLLHKTAIDFSKIMTAHGKYLEDT